jgi:hypothetical protein
MEDRENNKMSKDKDLVIMQNQLSFKEICKILKWPRVAD